MQRKLKITLNEYDMCGQIEFIWIRFGPVVGSCEHDGEPSDGFHFPAQIHSRLFEKICVYQ